RGPEHFDDLAFWINVARLPILQANNDFIAERRGLRQLFTRRNLNINVVDETRIVRHNVMKVSRLLECPDDRVPRAFQNSNDPAFASLSIFCTTRWKIAADSGDH